MCTSGAKSTVDKYLEPHQAARSRQWHQSKLLLVFFITTLSQKTTNSIKSWAWIHILLIFCDKLGSTQKVFLLHTEIWWLKKKGPCAVVLSYKLVKSSFSRNTFFLFQRTTGKLWLFRLEYMTDTFSKINKASLSRQEKQLIPFIAKDNIQMKKAWQVSPNFGVSGKISSDSNDTWVVVLLPAFGRSAWVSKPVFSKWPMYSGTELFMN